MDDHGDIVVYDGHHPAFPADRLAALSEKLGRDLGTSTQKVVMCNNWWGASIVRLPIGFSFKDGYEVATLRFTTDCTYKMDLDNPVADGDVITGLSLREVEEVLEKIRNLPTPQ